MSVLKMARQERGHVLSRGGVESLEVARQHTFDPLQAQLLAVPQAEAITDQVLDGAHPCRSPLTCQRHDDRVRPVHEIRLRRFYQQGVLSPELLEQGALVGTIG